MQGSETDPDPCGAMATVNYLEALLQEIRHIQDVAIVLLTLIMASVALRMYVRVWMTRRFGTEDWAMVLTFVCPPEAALPGSVC